MGLELPKPTVESILLFLLVVPSFVSMGSFQYLHSFVSRLRAKRKFRLLDAAVALESSISKRAILLGNVVCSFLWKPTLGHAVTALWVQFRLPAVRIGQVLG